MSPPPPSPSRLRTAQNRDDIKAAVFISAKPDNFIAGADINMLKQFKKEGKEDELKTVCMAGHATFDRIRAPSHPISSPQPTPRARSITTKPPYPLSAALRIAAFSQRGVAYPCCAT